MAVSSNISSTRAGSSPRVGSMQEVAEDGWHPGCACALMGEEFGVEPGETIPAS